MTSNRSPNLHQNSSLNLKSLKICKLLLLTVVAGFVFPSISFGAHTVVRTLEDRFWEAEPIFGTQLSVGATALDTNGISVGRLSDIHSNPIRVDLGFQFFHRAGILGIGPLIEYSPMTDGAFGWMWGGKVLYQLKYWAKQLVVPVAAYTVGQWFYRLKSGENSFFLAHGPLVGFWFDLGFIDQSNSVQLYSRTGISRVYFTVEAQHLGGTDEILRLNLTSLNFGFRMEI